MIEGDDPVKVSVQCLVFNQEPYLRQCLDGFVMQKTNFRFEAIVHDDCSTDGSRAIIEEYANKYPDLIKPIYEAENQYSKGGFELITNIIMPHLTGDYIAFCEGDDYWCDPLKLQKQVDFMESNPQYTLCFCSIKEIYEDNHQNDHIRCIIEDRDYTGVEWYKNRPSQTASYLFRRDILSSDLYKQVLDAKFRVGDIPLLLTCACLGRLRGMSDVMSVYRHHEGGWTSQRNNLENAIDKANMQLKYCMFGKEYEKVAIDFYQIECVNAFLYSIIQGRGFHWTLLKMSLKKSISGTLNHIEGFILYCIYKCLNKVFRCRYFNVG